MIKIKNKEIEKCMSNPYYIRYPKANLRRIKKTYRIFNKSINVTKI